MTNINFFYDKFALPPLDVAARLGLNKPERQMPDQIVEALLSHVQPAARDTALAVKELEAQPRLTGSRAIPVREYNDIIFHVMNGIDPAFGELFEFALAEKRIRYIAASQETKDIPSTMFFDELDTPVAQIIYDGTAQNLATAMNLAAQVVMADFTGGTKRMEAPQSQNDVIAITAQTQLFDHALFDTGNLPTASTDLARDLKQAERAIISVHSANFRLNANLHGNSIAKMKNMDFSEQTCVNAFKIHTNVNAPAMFIASALYEELKTAKPENRAAVLTSIFPGQFSGKITPLETLLAAAKVDSTYDLQAMFTSSARRLYSPNQFELVATLGTGRGVAGQTSSRFSI